MGLLGCLEVWLVVGVGFCDFVIIWIRFVVGLFVGLGVCFFDWFCFVVWLFFVVFVVLVGGCLRVCWWFVCVVWFVLFCVLFACVGFVCCDAGCVVGVFFVLFGIFVITIVVVWLFGCFLLGLG